MGSQNKGKIKMSLGEIDPEQTTNIVAEARASLKNPSRPFTPMTNERHLNNSSLISSITSESEILSRPSTAYSISTQSFIEPDKKAKRLDPLTVGRRSTSEKLLSISNPGETSTQQQPIRNIQSYSNNANNNNNNTDYDVTDNTDSSNDLWLKIKQYADVLDPSTPLQLLLDNTKEIWSALRTSAPLSSKYSNILQNKIISLMDLDNPTLLLRISCTLFLLTFDTHTLLTSSKLLYKLSKNDKNDSLFQSEGVLPFLLHFLSISHTHYNHPFNAQNSTPHPPLPHGVLVHLAGSLKNITTSDEPNQKIVLKSKGIELLAHLLLYAKKERASDAKSKDEGDDGKKDSRVLQLMVQVTGIFRNLSMRASSKDSFISSGALNSLCTVFAKYSPLHMLSPHSPHSTTLPQNYISELILNIVRIVSKLSVFNEVCEVINSHPLFLECLLTILKDVLENFPSNSTPTHIHGLVLRICFILGNLTGENEDMRLRIAKFDGAIDLIVQLFVKYHAVDEAVSTTHIEVGPSPTEIEQVLVKLIRLIANLSITSTIGPILLSSPSMSLLPSLLTSKSLIASEELVLNVVGAITNLSFYFQEEEIQNSLSDSQVSICISLLPILLHDNSEAVVEAVRALANLSRHSDVRAKMEEKRLDHLMLVLLGHPSQDVVFNVCGVLMNLSPDSRHSKIFATPATCEKILSILYQTSIENIPLSCLLCRCLYNILLIYGQNMLDENQSEKLCKFLDKVVVRVENNEGNVVLENGDLIVEDWRASFVQVAIKLIEILDTE
eukprot:TRINITY_DN1789_c0_g4_i1.p1 TRINITY_DN1789_c0_g4~~TRINITY_DN1789_c0_g4_i1.p1  ORF type:complete len:781 (+),score=173.23 TRINITY_DN1789_c0_g4_i1:193-2535(+)